MQIEIELRLADCNVMESQILAFAQLVIERLGCDWQIAMSHNLRYWHLHTVMFTELNLWLWDWVVMGEPCLKKEWAMMVRSGLGGWAPLWNVDIWWLQALMGRQTVIALRWVNSYLKCWHCDWELGFWWDDKLWLRWDDIKAGVWLRQHQDQIFCPQFHLSKSASRAKNATVRSKQNDSVNTGIKSMAFINWWCFSRRGSLLSLDLPRSWLVEIL